MGKEDDILEFLQREPNFDLLNLLKEDRLTKIEQCFRNNSKGLQINEFVFIILHFLDLDYAACPELKTLLTTKLVDMFKEIDMNDNKLLEWSEFINHIIELSSINRATIQGDSHLFKTAVCQVSLRTSKKSAVVVDKLLLNHKNGDLYLLQENGDSIIVLAQGEGDKIWRAKRELSASKKTIIAFELYFDERDHKQTLVTSSVDLLLIFWDLDFFKVKKRVYTPEIQNLLRFHQAYQSSLLFTGGADGTIRIFSTGDFTERSFFSNSNPFARKGSVQPGHVSAVSELLFLPDSRFMISAGLDGRLCLWDVVQFRFERFLSNDSNVKSISAIEWIEEISALVCTGSFHQINVYNIYVKEKIYSLKGHNSPIVAIRKMPGSFEVFTADCGGMVKVWDHRNWDCMQSLFVGFEINSLLLFSRPGSRKTLFVAGKECRIFQTEEQKSRHLTDENFAVQVKFNDEFKTLTTVHAGAVKVWSVRTGTLLTTFPNLLEEDICCFAVDQRQRKFFLAGYKGQLRSFNYQTGSLIRTYVSQKQKEVISAMTYYSNVGPRGQLLQYLICGYESGIVQFIDDSTIDGLDRGVYDNSLHKGKVVSLRIFREDKSSILVSAANDNSISMFRFEPLRMEQPIACFRGLGCSLLGLQIVGQGLIALSDQGNLSCVRKGFEKKHVEISTSVLRGTEASRGLQVASLAFDESLLIIGTFSGSVLIFDLSESLNLLDRKLSSSSSEIEPKQSFLTESKLQKSNFSTEPKPPSSGSRLAELLFEIKDAHEDKICSIEVLPKQGVFVTSCFRCKTILWRLKKDPQSGDLLSNPEKGLFLAKIGEFQVQNCDQWLIDLEPHERDLEQQRQISEILAKTSKMSIDDILVRKKENDKKDIMNKAKKELFMYSKTKDSAMEGLVAENPFSTQPV